MSSYPVYYYFIIILRVYAGNACSEFVIDNKIYRYNVKVMPQDIEVWLDGGKPNNAVVLDVGYNTINVFVIGNGKPNPSYSKGFIDAGVCIITSAIAG